MEEKDVAQAPAPATALPTLSPEEVHRNILRCHFLRHRVDRKLLDWLGVLIDMDYAYRLESSSPRHYVMKHLKYGEDEAAEIVKAARALPSLPRSGEAFEEGKISLSQLKAIADVAGPQTEVAWLGFAHRHNVHQLREEVREAKATGRKVPRKGKFGLPNRLVTMKLRLPRACAEVVRKAMEKKAHSIKVKATEEEAEKPTPESTLVAIAMEILASEDGCLGSSERNRKFCDLVIHSYPDGRNFLDSKDGPIEVSEEFVKTFDGFTRTIELSLEDELVRGEVLPPGERAGDLPDEVVEKVLAIFGHRCAHCGILLDLQIHHAIFRSRGGTNGVTNCIPLCRSCHGHVHDHSLEVFQDSLGNLFWRSRADKVTATMADEVKELGDIANAPRPAVVVPQPAASPEPREAAAGDEEPAEVKAAAVAAAGEETEPRPERQPEPVREEPRPAPVDPAWRKEAEWACRALVTLGYGKREARELVSLALSLLSPHLKRPPTGDEIINTALRERAVVLGDPDPARAGKGLGWGSGGGPGGAGAEGQGG